MSDTTGEEEVIGSAPGPVLLILLGAVVVVLTFGLGSTLDMETAKKTLQHRLPPALGILCQYIIMPALAYGLTRIFEFSSAKSIGLIICGIVPGGSSSNLFTYYVGGDVGLSIFLTVTSVLLAIGMVPLLLWLYGKPILKDSEILDPKEVPYGNLITSLFLVLIPTICGIYLRSKSILWAKRAEQIGSIIGVIFILVALATGIVDNLDLFSSDASTWVASASLSILGFSIASILSNIVFGLSRSTSLTIALEVGIQNTILAITMTFVLFADADVSVLNEALIFPLMCSLWDIGNSVLVTVIVLCTRCNSVTSDDDDDEEGEGNKKGNQRSQLKSKRKRRKESLSDVELAETSEVMQSNAPEDTVSNQS